MTFSLLRSLQLRYSTFNLRAFSVAAPVRTALPTDAILRTGAEDPSTWDDPDSIPDFGQYNVILPEEPFVYGTAHIPRRHVDARVPRPPYATDGPSAAAYAGEDTPVRLSMTKHYVQDLRRAARLANETLAYAGTLVQPGVTTDALDAAVHQFVVERGAYPSPLGYKGFPKSCCTSVNNVIAHGIPDDRPLHDGDIVNIDITVYLNGFHGDTSQTFLVGNVDEQGVHLVKTATNALAAGIGACGPGRAYSDIGRAIHALLVRQPFRYHVSSAFTGHGIGTVFHRPPYILHDLNDEPGVMKPGDCFTIEPCITQGAEDAGCWTFPDEWTASTENTARSAQAEHMVLITETGVDVLTE